MLNQVASKSKKKQSAAFANSCSNTPQTKKHYQDLTEEQIRQKSIKQKFRNNILSWPDASVVESPNIANDDDDRFIEKLKLRHATQANRSEKFLSLGHMNHQMNVDKDQSISISKINQNFKISKSIFGKPCSIDPKIPCFESLQDNESYQMPGFIRKNTTHEQVEMSSLLELPNTWHKNITSVTPNLCVNKLHSIDTQLQNSSVDVIERSGGQSPSPVLSDLATRGLRMKSHDVSTKHSIKVSSCKMINFPKIQFKKQPFDQFQKLKVLSTMHNIDMGSHDFRPVKFEDNSYVSFSSEEMKNDLFCNTPIEEKSRQNEVGIQIQQESLGEEEMFGHLEERDEIQRFNSPMNQIRKNIVAEDNFQDKVSQFRGVRIAKSEVKGTMSPRFDKSLGNQKDTNWLHVQQNTMRQPEPNFNRTTTPVKFNQLGQTFDLGSLRKIRTSRRNLDDNNLDLKEILAIERCKIIEILHNEKQNRDNSFQKTIKIRKLETSLRDSINESISESANKQDDILDNEGNDIIIVPVRQMRTHRVIDMLDSDDLLLKWKQEHDISLDSSNDSQSKIEENMKIKILQDVIKDNKSDIQDETHDHGHKHEHGNKHTKAQRESYLSQVSQKAVKSAIYDQKKTSPDNSNSYNFSSQQSCSMSSEQEMEEVKLPLEQDDRKKIVNNNQLSEIMIRDIKRQDQEHFIKHIQKFDAKISRSKLKFTQDEEQNQDMFRKLLHLGRPKENYNTDYKIQRQQTFDQKENIQQIEDDNNSKVNYKHIEQMQESKIEYDVQQNVSKVKFIRKMQNKVKFEKVWRNTLESQFQGKVSAQELKKLKDQKFRDRHELLKISHFDETNYNDQDYSIINKTHPSQNADMKANHNIQAIKAAYLIHPNSKFFQIWQFVIMIALGYCATIMPFKVCFIESFSMSWLVFDTLIDSIFLTDMIIVLNSPFINFKRKEIVISRKKIFINYLKGWLLIDFCSSFPLDFIMHIGMGPVDSTDQTAASSDLLKLVRIPRIYRIMRVARLYRVASLFQNMTFIQNIKENLNFKIGSIRLIQFLITTSIMTHIIACFWYMMAATEPPEVVTWVTVAELQDASTGEKYLASLYWAYTTMLTVGYGDITPHTDGELIFAIAWMCLGAGIYTQVIGNLASVLVSTDTKDSTVQDKLTTIEEFCKEANLQPELKTKLKDSIEYATNKNFFSWVDKQQILSELPANVRCEISLHMHEGIVKRINFFQGKDQAFIGLLVPLLQPCNAKQDELVYSVDQHSSALFFITQGRISFCVEEESDIGYLDMIMGSYFGEIEVIRCCQRLFSVKATVDSDFLMLTKQIFELYLIDDYPEIYEEMEKVAILRQEKISVAQKICIEAIKEVHLYDFENLNEQQLQEFIKSPEIKDFGERRQLSRKEGSFSLQQHQEIKLNQLIEQDNYKQFSQSLVQKQISIQNVSVSNSGSSDDEHSLNTSKNKDQSLQMVNEAQSQGENIDEDVVENPLIMPHLAKLVHNQIKLKEQYHTEMENERKRIESLRKVAQEKYLLFKKKAEEKKKKLRQNNTIEKIVGEISNKNSILPQSIHHEDINAKKLRSLMSKTTDSQKLKVSLQQSSSLSPPKPKLQKGRSIEYSPQMRSTKILGKQLLSQTVENIQNKIQNEIEKNSEAEAKLDAAIEMLMKMKK